jgi:3-phosphoshikimate 1-carboxyvinyltransferase
MSSVVITPTPLHGDVTPPPSKSAAHRGIICAALAKGQSCITPFEPSDDMTATIGAVKALGASVMQEDGNLIVDGVNTFRTISTEIDCLESGSTLRFLIPIAATGGKQVVFTGRGRLPRRPIGPYLDCLPKAGVLCDTSGGLPFKISGILRPGVFLLPGDISSQFITGLLLALPLLDGDSEIRLTTPLQSEGYISLTMDIMSRFGVKTNRYGQSFFVKGNQNYTPCQFDVEGDWSQAAFWLAAGAINSNMLGGKINCRGLDINSKQGDKAVCDILRSFGAAVSCDNSVSAHGGKLHGCEIDASQIPDLVPILAVVAALSGGRTIIGNAARLRIKESDRLKTTAAGLRALGANITEHGDALVIDGLPELAGGIADGAGDHRIVMALSIAAMRCKNPVTINGCESIEKSYPKFFEHYKTLGGNVNVIDMG